VLSGPPVVNVAVVQIIVNISQDEGGRAVGTVRAAGRTLSRAFSGNLEFLALIEDLYQVSTETVGGDAGANDKELS
jgi:hypothetical protein